MLKPTLQRERETMLRKWTELDDMAALYIYKFGEGTLMGAFLCAKDL
jgi:hypothetical protein